MMKLRHPRVARQSLACQFDCNFFSSFLLPCKRISLPLLFLFHLCLYFHLLPAQPTILSGTVNDYAAVLGVDTANQILTLESVAAASTYSANDLILIYQTQGASIQSANNATFGNISGIRGAGAMELATVCGVNGDEVYLSNRLTQTYYDTATVKSRIQLIRVPRYTDARVTGTLTGSAWNGKTGGVIALIVEDTLYLDGLIEASSLGFRGGTIQQNTSTPPCSFFTNANDYFYGTAVGPSDEVGGAKGEGIALLLAGATHGRGPQANGGGGGNNHNSGGGGGGNYAVGGLGGQRVPANITLCKGLFPGLGGKALNTFGYSSLQPRAFLGGGGGAGDDNNGEGASGGRGGGLVLVWANVIVGGGTIRANGASVVGSGSDGGSGGGAGGSILLMAGTISGMTLQANGGAGRDTKINCEGPGGGGAGGVIWTSSAPVGVTTSVTGGAAGRAQACTNNTQGATAGSAGLVLNTSFSVDQGTSPWPCILPVSQELSLQGSWQGHEVALGWTSSLPDVLTWRLHRQINQQGWHAVADFPADQWSALDRSLPGGEAAYQLEALLPSGLRTWSPVVVVSKEASLEVWWEEKPALGIVVSGLEAGQPYHLGMMDLAGRTVSEESGKATGEPLVWQPANGLLAEGHYFLLIRQGGHTQVTRLFLRTAP